jgi:hypothetical protein
MVSSSARWYHARLSPTVSGSAGAGWTREPPVCGRKGPEAFCVSRPFDGHDLSLPVTFRGGPHVRIGRTAVLVWSATSETHRYGGPTGVRRSRAHSCGRASALSEPGACHSVCLARKITCRPIHKGSENHRRSGFPRTPETRENHRYAGSIAQRRILTPARSRHRAVTFRWPASLDR